MPRDDRTGSATLLGEAGGEADAFVVTPEMTAPEPVPDADAARIARLRRASFRTGAELDLLAALGRAGAESHGDDRLDDAEARSLFRGRLALLAREALDRAARTHGPADGPTEAATRDGLEGMAARVEDEAARARVRRAEERALDTLEAAADDLADRTRRSPGLADGYAAQLDGLAARYADALPDERLSAFRANMGRELLEARVLGLAEAGRAGEARAALAGSGLPDGEAAFLEWGIVEAVRLRRREKGRAGVRRILALRRRIAEGDDVGRDVDRAEASGEIAPASARRLRRLRRERGERETRQDELVETAEKIVTGEMSPDGLSGDVRQRAADAYWERAAPAVLEDFEGPALLDAEARLIESLGALPASEHRRLAWGLRSGDAGERGAAASAIDDLRRRDERLAARFTDEELRHAHYLGEAMKYRKTALERSADPGAIPGGNSALAGEPAPPIPKYKTSFFNAPLDPETSKCGESNAVCRRRMWGAVKALPGVTRTEAHVYMEIFAAEGGMAMDGETKAGVLPRTLASLMGKGKLPAMEPGTPPRDLTLPQVAAFYRAYMDDVFGGVTGDSRAAMTAVDDIQVMSAVGDAVFRHGGPDGTRLVQEAINAAVEDKIAADAIFGDRTLDALATVARDAGRRRAFLDALAEKRHENRSGETARNEHFRFAPDSGSEP